MSKPHPIGPGIAAMIMGFKNEWARHDNGRVVIVVREHPDLPGQWVIRPRPGEGGLHTRGKDGQNKLSQGAALPARFLVPICPARDIHVMQEKRGD